MKKKLEPGMAYDTAKLNKLFAFLSLLFLMTVFWVFLDDYIRPWKKVQLDAMKIREESIAKQIEEEKKKVDEVKVKELETNIAEGQKLVLQRKSEIEALEKQLSVQDRNFQDETIVNGILNAEIGEVNFNYEIAESHGDKTAQKLFKDLRELKGKFELSRDRLKFIQAEQKKIRGQINNLKAEVLTNEKALADTKMSIDLLSKAKAQNEITPVFVLRNLPMIDFLDPTLKIRQVVLDNITDDRFFQHVPKVDRCITCHTFIDKPGFEDQVNPHKTHPKLELILGADSPHPLKKIGCTVCHGGEGHRVTDFNAAAHTPQNAEQKKEWQEKYSWYAPHKIPHPMLKNGMAEASCVKCHNSPGVEYVSGADTLNEGLKNLEKFGCYGCHKIEGWGDDRRMPGPSLEKVASKISKEFFKNWVWNPHSFNPHAKMPVYFNQSNNDKPEFVVKNIAEVNAMADYIWSISSEYKPFASYTGGNADNGKQLIKQVGCMGCHGVEGLEEESSKIRAHAGSYLTGTGSKLSGDWLVSWLKKPSHYQADTIMPSFRLSDREANDIAAYLLTLKNKSFEKLVFEKTDTKSMDEILMDYFSTFDTFKNAEEKLASMSHDEKMLELGQRSIGKYGCYSCHNISGFEGRAPIGPELSKLGSKPLTQFGFAHEKVEHSRDAWIFAHLKNPRRWDNGIDKAFKDLTRMPNYYMSDKEAMDTTIALLGRVSDYIPAQGKKQYSAHEMIALEGKQVMAKYNCVGCHSIDGHGGDITQMYQDDLNEGPPYLVGQGHRVQADWFHHFLKNVYPIRPWLSVRMPSFEFSNEEVNKIVTMFQAKSEVQTFEDNRAKVVWEPGERDGAKALFNNLACASCHTDGFNRDDPTAPSLLLAKHRLRPSWIKKWLSNPQAIMPYTVMPNFWDGGEAMDTEVFDGDVDKQINALTKYLIEMGTEAKY